MVTAIEFEYTFLAHVSVPRLSIELGLNSEKPIPHKPFDAHCCQWVCYEASLPDRVERSFVIWHPGTLTIRAERRSARMSKITNDGLTRSGSEPDRVKPSFVIFDIRSGSTRLSTVGVKGLTSRTAPAYASIYSQTDHQRHILYTARQSGQHMTRIHK